MAEQHCSMQVIRLVFIYYNSHISFMFCCLQILFITGLTFVIGLERTFRFFFQKHKLKGTSFFFGGIFVVLIGWPVVGMIVEMYGFFLLFRYDHLLTLCLIAIIHAYIMISCQGTLKLQCLVVVVMQELSFLCHLLMFRQM